LFTLFDDNSAQKAASRKSEVRSLEAGSRKQEAGGRNKTVLIRDLSEV
jgi:hypothetical protein